jgi:hypothetical protein
MLVLVQHIDGTAGHQVDEDRAVGVAPPQREVVHPEHARADLDGWFGYLSDEPDQRHPARARRRTVREAGAGAAAQCRRDRV